MITDIIFDLHHVLVDPHSVGLHYEAYLVKELAFTGVSRDRIAELHKIALKNWVMAFRNVNSERSWTEDDLHEFMEEMKRIDRQWEDTILDGIPDKYRDMARTKVHTPILEYNAMAQGDRNAFYPDVEPAIRQLKNEGYRLHVASSASEHHVRGTIDLHQVEDLFDTMVGYDTVQAPKKASNGIYFTRMLSHAKIDPPHAVFAGDGFEEAALATGKGVRFILIDRSGRSIVDAEGYAGFPVLHDLTTFSKVVRLMSRETSSL